MQPNSPYLAFCQSAARYGKRPMAAAPASAGLPWAPGGYAISYDSAVQQVNALRQAYATAGYGHGSRVALLLENRPEFILHWLALNAIGASIVPLNGEMRPEELAHQMQVSLAEAVIAATGFENLLAAGVPADVPVARLGADIPAARHPRAPATGEPRDEAALLFTSGSTGKPKACILSNFYFMQIAQWYRGLPGMADTEAPPVAMTPLPFYHMNALACTVGGMLAAGGTIVALDRFHPGRWWQTMADCGATLVHGLGVIPAILLQLPETTDDRRHIAKALFSPGVEAGLKSAFETRFGLPILEGWAMTETGSVGITDTVGLPGPFGPRCIGRPRAPVQWRLVDDEDRDVPPGASGELILRASGDDPRLGFFSGYLGEPDATEAAWAGGWFHTGDIMRVDAAGLFTFVDRKKSIVRRSGENISALEVEAALLEDPEIKAAAVTPVPDPLRGEEVFAFVVPATPPGSPDFAANLLTRLAARLSYHKLPGFLAVVESLPLGNTQKILRGQIKTNALAALREGRAADLRKLKSAQRIKAP